MQKLQRTSFVDFLIPFSLISILVFIFSCGGSTGTGDFELSVSEDTLEVTTFADGLQLPVGIAFDLDGEKYKDHVFVSEFDIGRVTAIAPNGDKVAIDSATLAGPTAILFDILPNNFFVMESQSNRIRRIDFDAEAVISSTVAELPQGVFPYSITTDGEFRYVAARNSSQLDKDQIYNVSTNSPQLLAEGFGTVGGIVFRINDGTPELLVPDIKAKAIYQIKLEEFDGTVVTKFKEFMKDVESPSWLAIGPASGFVYVAESGKDRIVRATQDGKNREVVAKINSPTAIAFDDGGILYVSSGDDGALLRVTGLGEVLN